MNSEWHNASMKEPCPICHHTDWCTMSNDGAVCVCRRVESDRPAKSGMGWIHSLRENGTSKTFGTSGTAWARVTRGAREARVVTPDFGDVHRAFDGHPDLQEGMAFGLGLDGAAFAAMDVRYNARLECMSFPMRDAHGKITGLRYRHLGTGKKWSAKGSKDGLFYASTARPESAPYHSTESNDELVIVEGPTDTAAALAIGLNAVGRSSCMTGAALLREYIRARRIRRVTVVADGDEPHYRPNGSWWRPGLDGAKRLVQGLGVAARIVLPPPGIKDFRDWYRSGKIDRERFWRIASGAKWRLGQDQNSTVWV